MPKSFIARLRLNNSLGTVVANTWSNTMGGTLRLVKTTGFGKGFAGFVTMGYLEKVQRQDGKPKLATLRDHFQLGPQSNNDKGGLGGGFTGSSFIDITQETVENTAILSNKNPSGTYDLFFHFHNDITHTFFDDADSAGWSSLFIAGDQHITTIINPG